MYKRKVEVFEMKCLGSMCDVGKNHRVRNSLIKERWCGYESSTVKRMEKNVLKWFGGMEIMEEDRMMVKR